MNVSEETVLNETILVTGAKGMIGSQLADGLLAAGYTVIGIDKLDCEHCPESYIHYSCDLGDKEQLKTIFKSHKIDRVIHLAALAHSRNEKNLTWELYKYLNVECAKNVFSVAEDIPVLFISTVDVFGFSSGKIITANTEIHPVTHYGKSKAMAEEECRKLKHYSIFRFSPVYTDEIKRDIQKRYYLKYPKIAYQISKGTEYEILNIRKAVEEMVNWCSEEPKNNIRIIKDDKPMWTPDYIKAEKAEGRAKIVLHFPRWLVNAGYTVLKLITGENKYTYLLNKAVYPFRTE